MKATNLYDLPQGPVETFAPVARRAKLAGALAIVVAAMGCAGAPPPEAVAAGPASAADGAMTAIDNPATEAATYEIRMHRPANVGRRGRRVATGEEHQKMQLRSNGQLVRQQREDSRVRFEAVETVVSIDD